MLRVLTRQRLNISPQCCDLTGALRWIEARYLPLRFGITTYKECGDCRCQVAKDSESSALKAKAPAPLGFAASIPSPMSS